MSNVSTLQKAGVVKPRLLSEAHKNAIEKLTAGEVKALISAKRKLSRHLKAKPGQKAGLAGQPWIL